MALANTIVAGAQKSGTTTLCRFLAGHPDCLVSQPKETNFFSRAENVAKLDRYEHCFSAAKPTHRIRVDGTTTYMADPAIAPRIRESLGNDIRIIFILRSPVARTYSSFLHMLKRGHERRTADEIFLSLPEERAAALGAERAAISEGVTRHRVAERPYLKLYDDVLWNYRYLGNSFYSPLVEAYLSVFEPQNVLVLFFEDFIRDIGSARQTLAAFLDVDPAAFPATVTQDNVTRIPDLSSPFGRLVEQARWVKRGNFTLVRPSEIAASPARPSDAVREKLDRILADEVTHWSTRTGRDLRGIGW
jgi:Sulfotransferase domain